jgi:hypothetical protein
VLGEDVIIKPEPEPQAMQQVPGCGWTRVVAAVSSVGAATAAAVAGAMQMGYLFASFLG